MKSARLNCCVTPIDCYNQMWLNSWPSISVWRKAHFFILPQAIIIFHLTMPRNQILHHHFGFMGRIDHGGEKVGKSIFGNATHITRENLKKYCKIFCMIPPTITSENVLTCRFSEKSMSLFIEYALVTTGLKWPYLSLTSPCSLWVEKATRFQT